jgi:hypothetical protein
LRERFVCISDIYYLSTHLEWFIFEINENEIERGQELSVPTTSTTTTTTRDPTNIIDFYEKFKNILLQMIQHMYQHN